MSSFEDVADEEAKFFLISTLHFAANYLALILKMIPVG